MSVYINLLVLFLIKLFVMIIVGSIIWLLWNWQISHIFNLKVNITYIQMLCLLTAVWLFVFQIALIFGWCLLLVYISPAMAQKGENMQKIVSIVKCIAILLLPFFIFPFLRYVPDLYTYSYSIVHYILQSILTGIIIAIPCVALFILQATLPSKPKIWNFMLSLSFLLFMFLSFWINNPLQFILPYGCFAIDSFNISVTILLFILSILFGINQTKLGSSNAKPWRLYRPIGRS